MTRPDHPDAHLDGPRRADGRTTYSASGVDLSLIREELARTPAERLAALTQEVAALDALRPAR
ncbi:MAG: hypothetical protein H6700_01765 [Myxococcales bacterium]|nr:hypothetical protein [Myxococcales bacterium]MCB9519783.1 hypothetical protein [Myxococcales bacterium]MCB9530474.1 hypothetical protein [Myxococcales bacterium]